jgi:hypothetical protein
MQPEVIWSLFNEMHNRALEIHAGEAPKKNFSACFNYFSPCPYFSNCHGDTFTNNGKKVKLSTIGTLMEETELL